MPIDTAALPYAQLVDAAPDGIVVADHRGTIVLVNAEAARMFGYQRDELLGQPITVLVPAAVRDRHAAHVAGFRSTPRLRPMGSGLELHGQRKDGSEFPVEISLSPIEHQDQTLVVAGIRDVTERRQIEAQVRRANAYLVSAVDAIQDAFAVLDEEDRIVMLNSASRQLLSGPVGGGVVGRRFEDVLRDSLVAGAFDFSDDSREALFQRWMAYHREPHGWLEVRTGRGRHLRVMSRKTPEHGTVCLMTDVTDDVLREAELRKASAAKSEFLSSMSHELRTPLNAVLGFAQLLEHDRKQPLTDRQRERLQHVLRGGEHLLRLIDDVLDLSRIEAGRVTMSCEPVSLPEVVRDVVTTLGPMASRAQITLAVAPPPAELPPVYADRTRLSQILMNYGSNAIKYGKPGGRATFEAALLGDRARITVVDDGIGIPADQRSKLFEPFQRAGQETGPIEGTGIGLVISKRLAELMQGRVGFGSEVGVGSRFWVEVPAHRAAALDDTAAQRRLAPSALTTGDVRWKVAYVEDNPSNVAFMRELLEDLTTIELLVASSAEVGLELIRAQRPAVVIMDINLPGMSGFDAARQLRGWPETRDIPVVGLSAAAFVRDTARAREDGFYRYLTKPVKVVELLGVLEELLVAR
jgi:PAS domain S-box-containing protein